MQDNTENSFNECDKGLCLISCFVIFPMIEWNKLSIDCISDNLNGSKLHEHDSGIDSSSYNSSINTKSSDKERPSTLDRTMTMSSNEKYEAKKSIFILIGIFSISLSAMFYVYLMFPELEE